MYCCSRWLIDQLSTETRSPNATRTGDRRAPASSDSGTAIIALLIKLDRRTPVFVVQRTLRLQQQCHPGAQMSLPVRCARSARGNGRPPAVGQTPVPSAPSTELDLSLRLLNDRNNSLTSCTRPQPDHRISPRAWYPPSTGGHQFPFRRTPATALPRGEQSPAVCSPT